MSLTGHEPTPHKVCLEQSRCTTRSPSLILIRSQTATASCGLLNTSRPIELPLPMWRTPIRSATSGIGDGAAGWQNTEIPAFLEGASAGSLAQRDWGTGAAPSWRDLAVFLYLGKIYE